MLGHDFWKETLLLAFLFFFSLFKLHRPSSTQYMCAQTKIPAFHLCFHGFKREHSAFSSRRIYRNVCVGTYLT